MKSVNIIGAGNVATHLAKRLNNTIPGAVCQIYARNLKKGKTLADTVGAEAIDSLNALKDVDLTIIAVRDDAIEELADQLPSNLTVVHTSGSKSVNLLSKFITYGILYPLQTFSINRPVNVEEVPFFIDAPDDHFKKKLKTFCKNNLSEVIHYADSKKRATLHLAAVIASNFSNQLLREAETILKQENLPLSVLKPLMEETISKAFDIGPLKAQTGPAKRGDHIVLDAQKETISNDKLSSIYELLSKRIQEENE